MAEKKEIRQGTLGLMILKTLEAMGSLHAYGIARRIEQISGDTLAVQYGTIYPLLLKLEQEGHVASDWTASENNRRAKYYRITRSGRKQLEIEANEWQETNAVVARFLSLGKENA